MNETKDTKELLKAVLLLGAMLAQEFKDGVQAQDAQVIIQKIMANEAIKQALVDAYNDIDKVPGEIKEVGAIEAISLFADAAPEFVQLINAIKGKA